MLTASERDWLRVREYLRDHRHELGIRAADGYPSAARVAGTPLLAPPAWRPVAPVPLEDVRISLSGEDFGGPWPPPQALAAVVPSRAGGGGYDGYMAATRALDAPAILEDRPLYRLTAADLRPDAGQRPRLEFGRGSYFESAGAGTAVAHEYAAAQLASAREPGPARERAPSRERAPAPGRPAAGALPLRESVGDPCDLAARPAMMAVATLTLRLDRASGAAGFPLHWRDPARVGHAGGMYQVIPAGIFQPSGLAQWNERNDFDLWRCMLREYAEEMLGVDEDHDSERAPIDYGGWPFARQMTAARDAGQVRAWCVGLGVDPLTFATDLLTVVVFDAPVYDELFGALVRDNLEGTVIAPRPLEPATVASLVQGHPVQAAGAALLALALRHRELLCAC